MSFLHFHFYLMFIKHIFQCLPTAATHCLEQWLVYLKNRESLILKKLSVFTNIYIFQAVQKCVSLKLKSTPEVLNVSCVTLGFPKETQKYLNNRNLDDITAYWPAHG